ncbi:uncharacterized protein LOC116114535 [Pistacia vera]|uniref:uncharacterized protein LOC116114535 n=1 Tax=Pistacia vera TaxID=55513 RepID=UPI001263B1BC|nr:uncharacterized protein LOC116114535 [Pistacia vera]
MENLEVLTADDVDDILQSLYKQINGKGDRIFQANAMTNAEQNSVLDILNRFDGKTFDSVQSHKIFELGSVVSWLTKYRFQEVKDKAVEILQELKYNTLILMNANLQQIDDCVNHMIPEPNAGGQIFIPLNPNLNIDLNPDLKTKSEL